ncbi:MAG: hypothetical protein HFI19_14980 [Lachnospiraceae bacterium]|jgi:hypothetical protein|uniref:hypothetical protein n=1 Tax=Candidatus Merdisoma sp. JLR.KK006 TaxID=3112626 RepID=UPI002FEEF0CB|nr:hypothetical protein [Lachnospiraceae bacterium]
MREYKKQETKTLERIICNGCGKIIAVKHGMPMEGVLQVQQVWEYMSGKDGEVDSFDLCEECYDRMTEQFRIPPTKAEVIELV